MDIYKCEDEHFEKFYNILNDGYINHWNNWRASQKYRLNLSLSMIKPILKSKRAKNILEIGCGTGDFTRMILRNINVQSDKIKGVDISQNAINICKKNLKNKNVEFECNKLPYLNYNDKIYDIIVCLEVLECFTYRGRKLCLAEIKKIAKTNSYLLLSTHVNKSNIKRKEFLKEISKNFKIIKVKNNYNNLYQFIEVPLNRFCNKFYFYDIKSSKNFFNIILYFLGKIVFNFLKSEKIMNIFIKANKKFFKNEIRNVIVLAKNID